MFAIIAGGVAVSQGPNADWTICLGLIGGLAACGVVYFSGIFEWISDKTLQKMADAEQSTEVEREVEREVEAMIKAARDGTLEEKYRFKRYQSYGWLALVAVLMFLEYIIDDAPMTDGASGMEILGNTLGTWRILGRAWTGAELLFITACLVALYVILRKGFDRLSRVQNP